jgi:hypothetical protein
MKDILKELVLYTKKLGFIDLIKITGTDKDITINAISDNKTVIVNGTMKKPVPGFDGVFGMPNLDKLDTILNLEDYDETSNITVMPKIEDDGTSVPGTIHFETVSKDFINDYRLMSKSVVSEQIKAVIFNSNINWNIEFEPTIVGIQRLKRQNQANSEEKSFMTKTENGDLKIYFGDHSTHSGNFVFQHAVSGTLNKSWRWPTKEFLAIVDLPGDKKIRFSDQGACEIVVDNGTSVYQYLFPAQTK